jgi:hypothetical protein
MAQEIARIFQQFDPARVLLPNDPRYVNYKTAHGESDLVEQLANAIRWSKKPLHLLMAGHRGGGKTTELLRLAHALENPTDEGTKLFAVYLECDEEDIDVSDADFLDLLLSIVRNVAKELREREGFELRPSWLNRLFEDLKQLLGSEVEFQRLEFDARIAKVTAAIKSSPDTRQKIRKVLEPNATKLMQEANKLFDESVAFLETKGYKNLVVIVDGLDRIVRREIPGSQFNTHEQFFIGRGDQLIQVGCHVVYTLPISLLFAPKAAYIVNIFDRRPDVLSMVKIASLDGKDDPLGMEAMRKIVRKRLSAAGVEESAAFDSDETLDYLCRMSGGHIRNLLILMRDACAALGTLPLTRQSIEGSVQQMSVAFDRALSNPSFFEVLREVDQTNQLPGSDYDEELIYNLSILEYHNGNVWYSVNPAVRLLKKFQTLKRAPSRRKIEARIQKSRQERKN